MELSGAEPGGTVPAVQLSTRAESNEGSDHVVVNATFELRGTENTEDTAQLSPHDLRAPDTALGARQGTHTPTESAFFRNAYTISQLDPKRIAPRSSDQLMQDQRLLGHQVLFRDRVFSDAGAHPL